MGVLRWQIALDARIAQLLARPGPETRRAGRDCAAPGRVPAAAHGPHPGARRAERERRALPRGRPAARRRHGERDPAQAQLRRCSPRRPIFEIARRVRRAARPSALAGGALGRRRTAAKPPSPSASTTSASPRAVALFPFCRESGAAAAAADRRWLTPGRRACGGGRSVPSDRSTARVGLLRGAGRQDAGARRTAAEAEILATDVSTNAAGTDEAAAAAVTHMRDGVAASAGCDCRLPTLPKAELRPDPVRRAVQRHRHAGAQPGDPLSCAPGS